MRLTLGETCKAIDVAPPSWVGEGIGEREINSISTDSRAVGAGDLFVALSGERFDGHEFVTRAFEAGAMAAVVAQRPTDLPAQMQEKCLVVADTLAAFGQIAAFFRNKHAIPVIGVTGSVGKTTTKEMIALAVSPLGPILKSEKNENNEVGVPQTLLRLNETYKAAVIEMGMRGKGEIAYLAKIAKPTIGVITVIGESHIERLGSRENIADAKGELLEALPPDGYAVLSADDPFFQRLRAKTHATPIVTSLSRIRGLHAGSIERDGDMWRTSVTEPDGDQVGLAIHSPARHDIANALLALAVALAVGVPLAQAAQALQGYAPPAMRMETFETASGGTVLDDSYNASPTSMKSALETLAGYASAGRKIAFLGDMKELGEHAGPLHGEVASFARALDIDQVYTVGEMMKQAFGGADGHFASSQDASEYATGWLELGRGDVVLVKGSRAMAMERIAEALRNR